MFDFVIRGTRGQQPVCGTDYDRYGGRTTCFSIQTNDGVLLIDAGTGLSNVPRLCDGCPVNLLFTHFHIDHILGLPQLPALAGKGSRLRIMADGGRDDDWKAALNTFVGKPFWPVSLSDLYANVSMEDLPAETDRAALFGVEISWMRVPHPQQCLSYRLVMPGTSVVVATDMEYAAVDDAFVAFCGKADFLIADAQYTPEEYAGHVGWGHSSWEIGVEIAKRAGVGSLILTHHAVDRIDRAVDAILEQARKRWPRTWAACDNMRLAAGMEPSRLEPESGG